MRWHNAGLYHTFSILSPAVSVPYLNSGTFLIRHLPDYCMKKQTYKSGSRITTTHAVAELLPAYPGTPFFHSLDALQVNLALLAQLAIRM